MERVQPPSATNVCTQLYISLINPYEAEIVREVFKLFLSGKSIENIFRHMSEKYGNCNYVWSNNTAVRRLLCNQTYAGKVTLGDLCCDGIHESIISEEDFLVVNTMLEHNQRISKRTYDFKSGHYKTDALLTGLLYCGDCGARMTSRKVSEKTRRYICHSVSRNNKLMTKSDNCSNRLHPFTQTQLDEIILNEICKLSLDQTKFESIVNYAPEINTPEMQVYEDRLTDIEKQIHRLLNLYQTGLIPMDDIADRVTPLKEEKEKLQKIILDQSLSSPPIAPDDAWNILTSFDEVLENGNPEEVHKIVHSLIDRIIVLNDEIVIHWSFC
jgi:site-specific DNA recombinase